MMRKSVKAAGLRPRRAKTFNFDYESYETFRAALEKRGASPAMMFRKFVTDFLSGEYVAIDEISEQTRATLENFRVTIRANSMKDAVELALNEWVSLRHATRKRL